MGLMQLSATVMSGRKFQLITTAIHMSNPDDDVANEARRGTADYDRLGKAHVFRDAGCL